MPESATACNCTICRRYGALWAYDYDPGLIRVSGPTKSYSWGRNLAYHFCPQCACVAYWRALDPDDDRRHRIAVNLRLADPDAVAEIIIDHFDGFSSFDDLPRDGRRVADFWF